MPILRARVDNTLNDAVKMYCQSRGQKEGELIRSLLREALVQSAALPSSPRTADAAPRHSCELANHVLSVAVTPSEKRAIAERARAEGMRPSRWVVWLARRHLSTKPHFNPAEVECLREAVRQLGVVSCRLAGRGMPGAAGEDTDMDRQYRELANEVQRLRLEFGAHIERSLYRWSAW
jgi:hypothetical protein